MAVDANIAIFLSALPAGMHKRHSHTAHVDTVERPSECPQNKGKSLWIRLWTMWIFQSCRPKNRH